MDTFASGLTRDLLVGTIGSIVGAIIISASVFGFRITRAASETAKSQFIEEVDNFKKMDYAQRSIFMQQQFFMAFRYFIYGTIVSALSGLLSPFIFNVDTRMTLLIVAATSVASAAFYIAALSRMTRLERIRKKSL